MRCCSASACATEWFSSFPCAESSTMAVCARFSIVWSERMLSTAAKSGSGGGTLPSPPPTGLEPPPFAAAEGPVVHGAVLVGRVVPQVVQADVDQAVLARPAQDAVVERPLEELRENGDDIENHVRILQKFET